MNLLITLLVGAVVGWLGALVIDQPDKTVPSVVIGMVGALLASILAFLLLGGESFILFSWSSLFWSLVGALLFTGVANFLDIYPDRHVNQ